jgi:hypothetical protein
MTDAKQAWEAVSEKLSSLGLKLKLHAEEEASDDSKEFTSALDRLTASINDVFDGLSKAARDPAVRDDARGIAHAFADAVDATVEEAKARLHKRA